MTVLTESKTIIYNFLSSFGKDIPDLRIECKDGEITGEIAYSAFYLKKMMIVPSTSITKEGTFHIMDLQKVLKFIKSMKSDFVTLRQTDVKKPLHIQMGSNKLQLPSTDDLESANKVPIVRKLIKKGKDSAWSIINDNTLSAHGTIDATELISLAEMKGIISNDALYRVRIDCGESEFGIVAGNAKTGRLFTNLPVENANGLNETVESLFGEWLPKCLGYLEPKPVTLHMGNNTFIVLEQDYDGGSTFLMLADMNE